MGLGPRVPGPRCPVETQEQTRKRRAARIARNRKAAQSGEGTHRPSPPTPRATTSGQGPSQLRAILPQTKVGREFCLFMCFLFIYSCIYIVIDEFNYLYMYYFSSASIY